MEIMNMGDLIKLVLKFPSLFEATDLPCPLRELHAQALEDERRALAGQSQAA
jgi:hypothetical protein